MSKIKKLLLGLVVVIGCIGLVFYFGLKDMLDDFSEEVSKIEINSVDLSNLEDGEYEGTYEFNELVGATVKVVIEDNRIVNIHIIEHKNGRGRKAEEIVNSVVNTQSLQVDTVSGATGSSIIILKAIEDALK